MEKAGCKDGEESGSNPKSNKKDKDQSTSKPNSQGKDQSTSNPGGPTKGDGGNGRKPVAPNHSNKDGTSSYDETWHAGQKVFKKFNVENAYVKPKHLSTSKNSNAKFNVSTKIGAEDLLREAMNNGKILRIENDGVSNLGNTKFAYWIDAGKIIGTRGEHVIKIVLSSDGGMLSAYPVIWP